MNPGRNPIIIILLNFIVGLMITHGVVTPTDAPELINQLADVVGLGIIFITSLYSLYQYFRTHHLPAVLPPPTPTPPVIVEVTQPPPTTTVEIPPQIRENPSGLPVEMLPTSVQN